MPEFYADRQPITVDDVFPGFILGADVSSTTSVGGGGKGLLSVDIIARVTRGWPMPPYVSDDPLADWDNVATPGYVLHCPLEDDPDRTVWHRLNAAGADMTKVALLERLALPADFGRLRAEIDAIGDVRLVVIDPWMSAAKTTSSANQQLRTNLLEPLMFQARETGAGIWVMQHFTKGTNNGRLGANSSKNLTDYVAGSKAFTDTLRANSVVKDSPADSKIKVWENLKANGGGVDPLEYMIVTSRPNDPDAHIEWRMPPVNLADPRVFDRIAGRVAAELASAPAPVTPQALAVKLGVPFPLVQRALAAMVSTGTACKKRGAYEPLAAISPPRAAAALPRPGYEHLPIGQRLTDLLNTGRLT